MAVIARENYRVELVKTSGHTGPDPAEPFFDELWRFTVRFDVGDDNTLLMATFWVPTAAWEQAAFRWQDPPVLSGRWQDILVEAFERAELLGYPKRG